jgi:AraC-like DNA-binding protein
VACTWERTLPVGTAPRKARIVPDGCTDLIWRDGALVIAGTDRGAFMTSLSPGETIVGLRLRPGVAGAAFGVPATELRDLRVPAEDVWASDGAELTERVGESAGTGDRRLLLEDAVRARLSNGSEPDELVIAAARQLGSPGVRVGELSGELAISERQLRRRFDAAVGYGPKTLDRVLRFQRFVALAPAVAGGEEELARAAAGLGYADQAHLSRDCVNLSGLTPSRLAAAWS